MAEYVLEEAEWREVVRYSNLSDEARPFVERAITNYRIAKDMDYHPAKTRASLKQLRKDALALSSEIEKITSDRLVNVVLTSTLNPPQGFADAMGERVARQHLELEIARLRQLAKLFGDAAKKVTGGKPGARTSALLLQFLVLELDRILQQFANKTIIRSSKRLDTTRQYIEAVCKATDEEIGSGSIDAAMKRVITARGRISSKS